VIAGIRREAFVALMINFADKAVCLNSAVRMMVVYGDPKNGTARLQQFPTLAIDAPPKPLVWQDAQGVVWFTLNSADYWVNNVYKRHEISASATSSRNLKGT
jgi:uncharacterized protein (DUF302 family)